MSVEIQGGLDQWDQLALDHRNLLFWQRGGRVQKRCGCPVTVGKMAAWRSAWACDR